MLTDMFPRRLWKNLIIPLGVLAVLFLILSFLVPCLNGLFVNLATTFLGILLTVCYVDYILRRYDKERWAATTARIESRIQALAEVTSQSFRTAFHIDYHVIRLWMMEDPQSERTEIIRVIRQALLPEVDAKVPAIDQKGWTSLKAQLQRIVPWLDHLITAFGKRLDPDVFSLILKIEDDINSIWKTAVTFFDVLGVPDDQLHAKPPHDPAAHKRHMERQIAINIKQILESCASILEWLNKTST
jgi:hypothetical protein